VTAIFAQVHGNAVCTRLFGDKRRLYRIGIMGSTRIANGSDMVDIHA
jgi:hypothetical protein